MLNGFIEYMNNSQIYNSKITKNYVEYLKKHYPDIDIHSLLQYAGIAIHQLEDEGHWLGQDQVDRFHEIIVQKTGNHNISRAVGRFTPLSAVGSVFLKEYILGFLSPSLAYANLEKAYNYVSRGCQIRVRKTGTNQVDIFATINPGVVEKPYQCENRIGTFEAIAELFTGKPAHIQHPLCLHNGGNKCHYIVTWEGKRPVVLKWMRNILLLSGIILLPLLFLMLPASQALVPITLYTVIISVVSWYKEHVDKHELQKKFQSIGDSSGRLMKQINITYNNAMLIQRIGQASSRIVDTDTLTSDIMSSIKECLDFDRGVIMLANPKRTRLVYKAAYGYDQSKEHLAKNISFHLDKPDSKGHFVLAFKQQQAFLVNDLQEIKRSFSQKSYEIAKAMGINSFICVPIVFEGRSEGILAVDNMHSKRILTQSDLNLLLGIAPQIGISINTARTYRQVIESEKRFRALGENSPDVIYTLNSNGAFTYINPACERLLGFTRDEIIGRHMIDFLSKKDRKPMIHAFKQIRDNGEIVKALTATVTRKDGCTSIFSVSGSPNFDSQGNVIGLVGTMKDVTVLEESVDQLQEALEGTIHALSSIVESRDPYTAGHERRVTTIACAIAEEMGLPEETIRGIRTASMIHDIGKIYVPAEILNKPGTLSKLEFDMVKTHPEVGHNILKKINFSHPVARIVHQHHERLDGSGYPQGISGDEILLEARIIAVADVVEAMASHRPYRPSVGLEKALEEISGASGILYDPEVVTICLKLFREKSFEIVDA